jgi:HK97 family phage major capsid protein
MNKLLKELKRLMQAGKATEAEKEAVRAMVKELDAEGQEVVKDQVEEVENLPTGETTEEDIQEGVKALVKSAGAKAVAELQQAAEDIKNDVKNWLKEQAELREKKAGVYQTDVAEKRKDINNAFRKLITAHLDKDENELLKLANVSNRKELTTDATGSPYGGYVVDRELSAEIRHLITQYGAARREFMTMQLSKNEYVANSLVTDVTVFWVDEGTAIPSTEVVLGQDSFKLKKLAAIVTLTRELLEDQEVDLFGFIGSRVAEKLARAEDLMAFVGDGTSTYGGFDGILTVSGVTEVPMTGRSSFEDLTADDLLDMQDATPTSEVEGGKYYMHRTILSVIRKLKDDENRYIYQEPGGSMPATIWNKPVVIVEAMPSIDDDAPETAFILFGNLKRSSIFGYKGAISADRFNAGVVRNVAGNADINLITTDREAIRWVERVGCFHIMPQTVTRLVTDPASA